MTKDEVRRAVIEEIQRAQWAQTGESVHVSDVTSPLDDLLGFDSPLAEDVTGVILLRLGLPVKAIKSPFLRRSGTRYAAVGQIVDAFWNAYAQRIHANA